MTVDDDRERETAHGDDAESDGAHGDDAESDDAPGRDPVVDGEDADGAFPADPERAAVLRATAEDLRGDSSESEQLANVLYRTSDIYDPGEETTPEEVMQNVKFILEVKERGGLGR
jgi:hypothetical protein